MSPMNKQLSYLALLNDNQSLKKREILTLFTQEYLNTIFDNNQNFVKIKIENFPLNLRNNLQKIQDCWSNNKIEIYSDFLNNLERNGVHVIPYNSDHYPKDLLEIENPPFIIYHKGLFVPYDNSVAIVGTRKLSHFGHKKAREISSLLAEKGYTIVSGLARGTDTEAHCGALDVGGKTIAVLPGSITKIVPDENERLADDICQSGALISEISDMSPVHKGRFIERNRITSAISKCVIVIESGESGGSFQQSEIALKQGRKIFILKPKGEDRELIRGFEAFVNLGATPFESEEIILEYLKNEQKVKKNITLSDFS